MASIENKSRYARFLDFEFDPRSGELRSGGQTVAILSDQPLLVLSALLERPGELVGRDDLQKKLWPDDTVVEYDHSINVAVNKLRKILGDRANEPRCIQTIASRGYRWVAPLEWLPSDSSTQRPALALFPPDTMTAEIQRNQRSASFFRRLATRKMRTAAITATLLMMAFWTWHFRASRAPSHARIRIRKVTNNSQELPVRTSAMSPDGKYIAYSDKEGVHIQATATGESRRVPQLPSFRGFRVDWQVVAWFPDSVRFLANIGPLEESCLQCEPFSAWVFSVLDDQPYKLRDNVNVESVSPDGLLLAYTADLDIEGGRQIVVTKANGDQPLTILEAQAGDLFRFVRWSPDGQHLSYIYDRNWRDPRKRSESIESIDLRGNSRITILQPDQTKGIHDYVWLSDGRMIFGREEASTFGKKCNYWQMSVGNGRRHTRSDPVQLSDLPSGCLDWTTSTSDATRLSFIQSEDDGGIYVAELSKDVLELTTVRRLTLREGFHQPTAWSRDGATLFFVSHVRDGFDIHRQSLTENRETSVIPGVQLASLHTPVTPDGLWVLFLNRGTDGRIHLTRVPVSGGTPSEILRGELLEVDCPSVPTASCVMSETSDLKDEVVFSRFDVLGGRRDEIVRVPANAAFSPLSAEWRLSPDGSQIAFYVGTRSVHILSFSPTEVREVHVEYPGGVNSLAWDPQGHSFYSFNPSTSGWALLRTTLSGKSTVLHEFKDSLSASGSVSPDGRFIAMRIWNRRSNVWIIDGI
jgi:eukaryotic-like serine/threonine-protein kinase